MSGASESVRNVSQHKIYAGQIFLRESSIIFVGRVFSYDINK